MARICFFMIVFEDDYVLRECLDSVLPFGPVVAVEGPVAYWQRQGGTRSSDETLPILAERGVPVLSGQWAEKDEMCRAGEALVPAGTDFVWVLDADEVWDRAALQAILALLDSGRYDSLAFSALSFYGGFERYMTGFEENYETHRITRWQPGARWLTHRPPTVLAPDGRPWREHRHLGAERTRALGLRFHHYSYVWPSQMRRKAAYYHDRDPGGTIPDYFAQVYLPWVRGDGRSRRRIEARWRGVHNWLPERRGDCYTAPFAGRHPARIRASLPRLQERFLRELGAFA